MAASHDKVLSLGSLGNANALKPVLKQNGMGLVDRPCNMHTQHIDLDKISDVCAILLNETFAQLDIKETLSRLKSSPVTQDIPIIVAAHDASPDSMSRYMNAGAYYVLSDTQDPALVTSILLSAAKDFARFNALRQDIEQRSSAIGTIVQGTFQYRTLSEAQNLATMLSLACPNSGNVAIGLTELLVNAVEHGNLEIGYEQKSELIRTDRLREEIGQRLTEDAYKERVVTVDFRRTETCITFFITDQGHGFDPTEFFEIKAERMLDTHGRGIAIARATCFDELRYDHGGRQAKAVLYTTES